MSADTDTTTDQSTSEPTAASSGFRAWLTIYLKGIAMGAADTVPGVSGGTIALITGVYERLVRALTRLDPRIIRHAPALHTSDGRAKFIDELRRMDTFFLMVLGLGVVTSIVTLSRVVHVALETARPQTFAFFFGLIAASAIVLYRELSFQTAGQIGAGVAGFGFAFAVSGAAAGGVFGNSLPVIFLAGAVAITAMILPGISGSFILILLGQYEYLTGVLKRFVDGLLSAVTGGGTDGIVSSAIVVGTWGTGAVIGLVTIAHVIRWALDNYRTATMVFLVSLMVGSLRLPILEVTSGIETWTATAGAGIAGAIVVGAGAVLVLDYVTADLSEMAT